MIKILKEFRERYKGKQYMEVAEADAEIQIALREQRKKIISIIKEDE